MRLAKQQYNKNILIRYKNMRLAKQQYYKNILIRYKSNSAKL